MARALVQGGAQVLLGSRDPSAVQAAAESLAALPGTAAFYTLDVRDPESVARFLDRAEDAWGGLDLLINNAGLGMVSVNPRFFEEPEPFWEVAPEGFRAVVDTNLTGYFLAAREAVRRFFLPAGAGRIVNVSMNHETMTRRGFVPYGPSRAGAEALSRIMEQDLSAYGVAVNMLLPGGATLTGMIPEAARELPGRVFLSPAVMERPARFLASPLAAALSGERIEANDFDDWCRERGFIVRD
jgi:gluconate 5-dehydrogenase